MPSDFELRVFAFGFAFRLFLYDSLYFAGPEVFLETPLGYPLLVLALAIDLSASVLTGGLHFDVDNTAEV